MSPDAYANIVSSASINAGTNLVFSMAASCGRLKSSTFSSSPVVGVDDDDADDDDADNDDDDDAPYPFLEFSMNDSQSGTILSAKHESL